MKVSNIVLKVTGFIAALTALTCTGITRPEVFAQTGYTIHMYETFEDKETMPEWITVGKKIIGNIDTETFADTESYLGLGTAVSLSPLSKDSSNIHFSIGDGFELASLPDNTYVETEFDAAFGIKGGGANIKIYLSKNSAYEANSVFDLISSNRLRLRGTGSDLKTVEKSSVNRYKITMYKITDSGLPKWAISSIKVNGEEILPSDQKDSVIYDKDYTHICIRLGSEPDSDDPDKDCMFFDNISVTSYVSETGESPVPDRYALLQKIKECCDSINKSSLSSDKKDTLKQRAMDELDIFRSAGGDIDSSSLRLDAVNEEICAFEYMAENNTEAYIGNAQVSADSLIGNDSIQAHIPVYASEKGNVIYSGIGVLYKKSGELFGNEIADILPVSGVEVPAGEKGSLDFEFDLSPYSENDKAQMSFKIMPLKELGDILTCVPAYTSFFEEREDIDSSVSFVDSINISTAAVDENTQKIVFAVKGTAEKHVSLTVLKQNKTEADLENDPKAAIEFYDAAVFDEQGRALFEVIPGGGTGNYTYIINSDEYAKPITNYIYYADVGEIREAFDELYQNRDLATLEKNKKILCVDTAIYENAVKSGVDVEKVLNVVLEEKRYDALTLNDFTSSILNKLDMVYKFRTVTTADEVIGLLKDYASEIKAASDISELTSKQAQTAYTQILNNKKSITALSDIETVISDAVTYAKKQAVPSVPVPSYGGGGGGSGGGGAAWKGTVNANKSEKEENITAAEKAENLFNDIDSVEWAKNAIMSFALKGFVNGKAENTFAPNDAVTREEFVKMAVNVFGLTDKKECAFEDTDKNEWYYPYIEAGVGAGIINGIDEKSFGIGRNITREDMAVIIYRIAGLSGASLTEDGVYIQFADEVFISDYAAEAVIALAKTGLINGKDNNCFAPKDSATRAEAVKMLYELYILKENGEMV